ncbi:MAG: DUF885 family protein [Woeseia sp.]|nr:DUF885 family protein [Woeseia sp.]MBT6208870.1 DUF885 family protein [Woeseia sp.]
MPVCSSMRVVVVSLLLALSSSVVAAESNDYDQLVSLFQEFREMTGAGGSEFELLPVVDPEKIAAEKNALQGFQARLRAIDPASWPVPRQVDYHLVRAELNGLEFKHRVTRPWFRDPGTYSDIVLFMGEFISLPVAEEDLPQIRAALEAIPAIFSQAMINLQETSDIPGDLTVLAIRDLSNANAMFDLIATSFSEHNPSLLGVVDQAIVANNALLVWLKEHQSSMTAQAGVGREEYDWLLKNVYLFPYSWDELRTLVELEDNRVIVFQRLEENRNRAVERISPVQSQAEYKQSVQEAIDDLMSFLREQNLFSVPDYLTPDDYFGSWHGFDNPWPDHHDYFFNFSHREPRMEEAHEMVGHHFDQLRGQNNTHPIRKGWRPYKISTARTEGFAFALEELLMHAGYLDSRSPRSREIAYEQAAFRTVRAISDIYMHDNQWTLSDAMEYCVANAPHGELLNNSPHLWFEMATTLRGVGHHMLMVVGKVQFMKLMRDYSQQQGEEFVVNEFMDEFFESGLIPMSLIRWELTGLDDEVSKLW